MFPFKSLTPNAAVCGGHGYTNDGGIWSGPSALGGLRRVLLLWWFEWNSISAGDVGDSGRRSPDLKKEQFLFSLNIRFLNQRIF